ncbi:MAG: UDP-glucose/GDP-mannose dehydrogenase family protein [Rickettsiales bacterium]|nr:UDP-glucose/GDP-mannose dehydrogenase family protein [Rickettsiales bacterium]
MFVKKNIAIIGSGYVGLVSALCLAEIGHNVTAIDKDADKIAKLNKAVSPIYEAGLENLLKKNLANKNISFTTNLAEGLKNKDACFIAVGTPYDEKTQTSNLSYLYSALDDILNNISNDIVIINKSTVPLGTAKLIKQKIEDYKTKYKIYLASNPEFLSQGRAVKDFQFPMRIIIGVEDEISEKLLQDIYQPFINESSPIISTNIASAELIKYASNSFLALKVSFINEIAQISAKTGANIEDISYSMGLDERIGDKFLKSGPGYGGSCFPKDTISLAHSAKELSLDLPIIKNINFSNDATIKNIADKIDLLLQQHNMSDLLVMGAAFKAGTDDIRDSQSLKIIAYLQEKRKNINIAIHDPFALKHVKENTNLKKSQDLKKLLKEHKLIVIATEWREYQELSSELFLDKIVVDLRGVLRRLANNKNYFQLGVNF